MGQQPAAPAIPTICLQSSKKKISTKECTDTEHPATAACVEQPVVSYPEPTKQPPSIQQANKDVPSPKWKMCDTPSPSDSKSDGLDEEMSEMLQTCLTNKPRPKPAAKKTQTNKKKAPGKAEKALKTKQAKDAQKAGQTKHAEEAEKAGEGEEAVEVKSKVQPKKVCKAKKGKANRVEAQADDWPPVSAKVKRHRFVSMAYHKEFDAVYKLSKDKAKAKDAARLAYKKAAEEWKAKHVDE